MNQGEITSDPMQVAYRIVPVNDLNRRHDFLQAFGGRRGLVEFLLGATDAGLDVVEDVVRRLGGK